MTLDRFTKAMLIVIAVLLGMVAFRPLVHPAPVQAQANEVYPFYIEPGYTTLRKPDGTAQVYGKMPSISQRRHLGIPDDRSGSVSD